MKYKANRHGEYPPGIHWTPGEVRDLDLTPDQVEALPYWLAKPATAKPKPAQGKKKKAPKEEG